MRILSAIGVAAALLFTSVGAEEAEMDSSNQKTTTEVVDFSDPEKVARWMIVNDGVMGGLSASRMEVTEDGHGLFSGTVSLESNGGFASTRALLEEIDLTGHAGIYLRVKGDGQRYQFRIRTNDLFDGAAYRNTFETEDGRWTEIRLPFADFVASFRGRVLGDAPAIDPGQIRQVGFLIADKQAGAFRLEIDRIEAYK